jgi:maltooligosyltrehalose trehalohydrolase
VADFPWQRPLGAVPVGEGEVEFRVWAPKATERVEIRLLGGGGTHPLEPVGFGIYEGRFAAAPGDDYYVLLDGRRRPDPCSRHQPRGLRGPSRVVDTAAFASKVGAPPKLGPLDLVLYEMHVGCFTAEGTFDAAREQLPALAELGVTAVEVMPVAAFPGERGWGYDGVYIYAPFDPYGGPAGLARFVDAAHAAGLAVILDCVYNHLGTSGTKAMTDFGPYFSDGQTGWGKGLNYDGAESDPVREWAIQNAEMWVRDFGIDGLRLDAVHAIGDQSPRHLVAELTARVHAVRDDALVIAESNANDPATIRPASAGGWGVDAQWADDFHHSLRTLLTGEEQGYYADFGTVADLAKAFDRPFVYDGGYSRVRQRRVGAPAPDRPPQQFVVCSQNHDQVGNRALGDRMPAEARPLAALCTLLSPFTPMLFMGEEYGEEQPFQFFTDHIEKKIAEATRKGRRREFEDFVEFAGEVPDPQDPATFERSKRSRRGEPEIAELYRRLFELRRELGHTEVGMIDFDEEARWLRFTRSGHEVVCNFAREPQRVPCSSREIVLATHAETTAADADGTSVALPALAGAVLR